MQRRTLLTLLVAAAIVVTPAFAAKVYIDYDRDADLKSYETWQYKEHAEHKTQDPLMDDRIVSGLSNFFSQGKLKEVDSDPDLYVSYAVSGKEQTQLNTTYSGFGYGYGGGWGGYGRYGYGGGGMTSATTTATTYLEGTLIVDIWDAKTNNLVWRGTSTQIMKQKPEKIAKQIDKAFQQMGDKWDKMKAKQGQE